MYGTTVFLVIFFIAIVLYVVIKKRQFITELFTLDASASAVEFQKRLEQTADEAIKRMEGQIAHLEYLLEAADAKISLLEEQINVANKLEEIGARKLKSYIEVKQKVPPTADVVEQRTEEKKQHQQNDGISSDKRKLILTMADQGYSVTEIAKATGTGKGEVLLLLQLNK